MHRRCRHRHDFGALPPSATSLYTASGEVIQISPAATPAARRYSQPIGSHRSHEAASRRAAGF